MTAADLAQYLSVFMLNEIIIINGPNLDMLDKRDPAYYGSNSMAEIQRMCLSAGLDLGIQIDFFQSNCEGRIVTKIQQCSQQQGVIINAAAYSHTSVAIMDALLVLDIPIIEVHLSNIFQREQFRHNSYVAKAATGVICGLGVHSYIAAIYAMHRLMQHGEDASERPWSG